MPELPAWAAPIRLHHLIHHTSGLPEKAVFDKSGVVREWTNETVLDLLSAMREPQAAPGITFSYSSIGYVCLTTLVERAGGQPIAEFAQKRLFNPLGMASTRFWQGPPLHPPTVTIHPPWHPSPAPEPRTRDGIWSTARDMLRWAEGLQTGVLGPRLTATLRQPGRLRDGSTVPYAWGSFIVPTDDGGLAYAHGGSWPGCHTYVISGPTSSAVAVAFTDDPARAEAQARSLVRASQRTGSPIGTVGRWPSKSTAE